MMLALVFILIAVVWLIFRKWIARQQYLIVMQTLGGSKPVDEERVKALEKLGVFFCILLLLAGMAMLILNFVYRP